MSTVTIVMYGITPTVIFLIIAFGVKRFLDFSHKKKLKQKLEQIAQEALSHKTKRR